MGRSKFPDASSPNHQCEHLVSPRRYWNKRSIRSEMETASVVMGGAAKVVEVQDNYFTARCGDIASRGKSADPIVDGGSGNGIINVDVVVVGEVWIEGDPEQAALA